MCPPIIAARCGRVQSSGQLALHLLDFCAPRLLSAGFLELRLPSEILFQDRLEFHQPFEHGFFRGGLR